MAAHLRWSFGRSGIPVGGTLVLVCACTLPLVSDQGGRAQVVVVSVSGQWTPIRQDSVRPDADANAKSSSDAEQHAVRFGETLTVGSVCLFGPEDGSIVLKYSTPSDNALYPFPCDKAKLGERSNCHVGPRNTCAVDLRTVGEKKSLPAAFMATISDAFARLTRTQPEKYMVAASRGAEAELADAVVPLEGGEIDLRAAFRDMDSGAYSVKFAPIGAPIILGPASRVTYAKGQATRLEAPPAVRAGLYKVGLVSQTGEPGDSDCWVLVAAPPEYARQARAFEKAVSESTKLPEEMDAGATRALLRAYLESLGSPKPGETRP
jgi:hypothetical protein